MYKIAVLLIFLFCLFFFSFRLLEVPKGITIDEAAFGYNASLIADTSTDENGRFLPVFVLSLDGRDWRQPLTQYFQVAYFKLFGKSLFNLKFTSVLVIAFSAALLFILGEKIKDRRFGIFALLVFITTPIIMIHSHLALDNIMPLPFILLWLLGICLYQKTDSSKFLLLAGISLGLSFYAHKSMRSASPVWTVLTLGYLILPFVKQINVKKIKPAIFFLTGAIPFFLISPILDYKYAGAVYGNQDLSVNSVYDFVYYYISNFDSSFLFIKGDSILHHSTGKHGMFLLAALPVFAYGIFKSFTSREKFMRFMVYCFFLGPLLLGFIGSVHRASRLIFLVPLFVLIAGFGLKELLKIKRIKVYVICFLILAVVNYLEFINYYWFKYGDDTEHIFYSVKNIQAYAKLDEIAKKKNLKPLIDRSLLEISGDPGTIEDFSRSLFFTRFETLDKGNDLEANSILLTSDADLNGNKVDLGVKGYYLYKK